MDDEVRRHLEVHALRDDAVSEIRETLLKMVGAVSMLLGLKLYPPPGCEGTGSVEEIAERGYEARAPLRRHPGVEVYVGVRLVKDRLVGTI